MKSMYMLDPVFDVAAYEGYCFANDDELMELLLRTSARHRDQAPSLLSEWVPPSVIGRVQQQNDYPSVYPFPVFSAKAIEALGDLLLPNGEFLPLNGALPGVMLFHVQSSCTLLDLQRSDVNFYDKEKTEVLAVEHFVLNEQKAASFSAVIFRLPELPTDVFVSEEFVERVFASGLKGLEFCKAWPVERGVVWRQN